MRFHRLLLIPALILFALGETRAAGRVIYPDAANAHADLAAAIKTAAQTHKRVLVDFGGNWCGDCQVLDLYLHNSRNLPLLEANFVLVHINVGRLDTNLDIAERYQVPVTHGVPGVAVLSDTGKLLYSARNKELEMAVQHSDIEAVTRFLVQWKPSKSGCSMMAVNC